MKKSSFNIFLIFLLIMSFFNISHSTVEAQANNCTYSTAEEALEVFGYEYSKETEGYRITSYKNDQLNVCIPSEIPHANNDGSTEVTEIGRKAFDTLNGVPVKVTSVTIPDTIEIIGMSAFNGANLTNLDIPDSVEKIGQFAFERNNLTTLNLGTGIEVIEGHAFSGNSLSHVTIPNNVQKIKGSAFKNNELEEIIIPETVTEVESYAFQDNEITEATLSSNIETIPNRLFAGNKLRNITIPASVKRIEMYAFNENELEEVVIPSDVTHIGNYAFANNKLEDVVIPENLEENRIFIGVFQDNQLNSVTIPDGIKEISKKAFESNNLTSISFPETLERIYDDAFRNNKLTSIVLPKQVDRINYNVFRNNFLSRVEIQNENISHITGNPFSENQSVPADLTFIGYPESEVEINANRYGYTFESIEESGEEGVENDYEWSGNEDGTVTITDYVGTDHFITIPDELDGKVVTAIGDNAFEEKGLNKVELPDSVAEIGDWAFFGNKLTEVELPDSVTDIGGRAFSENDVTKVVIYNAQINLAADIFNRKNFDSKDLIIHGYSSSTAEEYAEEFEHTFKHLALVEKDALADKVNDVETYDEEDYTTDSFDALEDALAHAEAVLAKDDATQDEVDAAIAGLDAAMTNLEDAPVSVDKKELENKVDDAEVYDETDYTTDSFDALTTALAAAKTVLADDDAKQDEVDNAWEHLETAIEHLEDATVEEDFIIGLSKQREIVAGKAYKIENTNATVTMPSDLPVGTLLIAEAFNKDSIDQEGLTVAGDSFTFTFIFPEGKDLPKQDYILTMGFDNDVNENNIGVYYLNETKNNWEERGGEVDENNQTITLYVPHFSTYAVLEKAISEEEDKETPGEISVGDAGYDSTDKGKTGKDSEDKQDDPKIELKHSEKDEEKAGTLPSTATNVFNILALGLGLLAIGMITLMVRRKISA